MDDKDEHMVGFEKEDTLIQMWHHPDVTGRLIMFEDFMSVARVVNPELCEEAFERRPCKRKLRYIANDNFDEPFRYEKPIGPFIYRNLYHSIDFNGATYTFKERDKVIGSAYFEVVDDQ